MPQRYRKQSTVESQIAFLTREFSQRPPCPACARPVSRFEAAGKTPETYPFFNPPEECRCPHCGAALVWYLPLAGGRWSWARA